MREAFVTWGVVSFVIGMAFGAWLWRPHAPRPHKHNWTFTNASDGVIATCVACAETRVTLYKDAVKGRE